MNKSKDIKPLTKIKNRSDIKSFKVVDEYEDLGCLYYWKDSEKAFKDLKAKIKNEVYLAKNYELDFPEDA